MINIFIASIILAIWAVVLFIEKSIGLSMLLFAVPFTFFLINILEKNNKIVNKKAKLLIIPIVLLSSTYFIYNNSFFNTLNLLVIPLLVIFMIWQLFDENIEIKFSLIGKIFGMLLTPLNLFSEAFTKTKQELKEKYKASKQYKNNENIKKVIRAILITLPVILVVIALLSSADQAFGNIFKQIFYWIQTAINQMQISVILIKIISAIIAFIYLLGGFYFVSHKYVKNEQDTEKTTKSKDIFTMKIMLGSLNVIYFIFCIIQLRALFINDVSINYAEYARQGFFQLMIVSIINLVTILYAKKNDKKSKYISIMCVIMVAFTFIILISSAYRMYLYESAYGYTLLRLLVYFSLFTEGILLIPTVMYILNKRINLKIAYFSIIIVIYLGMNFINFNKIIAKRNVDRYETTGKIDIAYMNEIMGPDTVEEEIRLFDNKNFNDITENLKKVYLRTMYNELEKERMDFRDFNISKLLAKEVIKAKLGNDLEVNQTIYELESNININTNTNTQNDSTKNKDIICGIVKKKTGNQLEISYAKDAWESLGIVNFSDNTVRNKQNINVGDWVEVSGVVSSNSITNVKSYEADMITVTTEKNYQKELKEKLLGITKLNTEIVFNYESEGGGDGYVFCSLNFGEYSSEPEAYVKINYNENTQMYLGMGRHLQSNYGIHKYEIVDVTFTKPVTDVNNINANMFEYIAD